MDSGLSLDTSSEVHGGQSLALAAGSGLGKGGKSRFWGEGVTRAELQTEQDGGDSPCYDR